MPRTQRQHGKSNKITLPQHSTTSGCRQVKSTSFDQEPFPCQSETGSTGRKSKILFRKLGKINSRGEYLMSIVQGFKIPFSQTPFQYGPPQLARVNQEERLQINSEIKEMLRKGAFQQVKSEPGEFLSNLFLVNKKDGDHRPVINLKFLNNFIPYQHFKMEGMHLIKDPPRTRLFYKDRSKRCLFWNTSRQKLNKIYSFSMGRKCIRIPLLIFWHGPSPSDFHKTSENPNCLIKED